MTGVQGGKGICKIVHENQNTLPPGLMSQPYHEVEVNVDDINLGGRKQHLNRMWKKWMKLVDLGQPTSFLDHVYLGCAQRECKSNESIVDEDRKCSNHESLPEQQKSYLAGTSHANKIAWSYNKEGHAKKCVERYCESANKKTEQ